MMTVLLLGAGASKAYNGSSTGLKMPIAADFFRTFEKLAIFSNPWVLREALWEYLYRVRQVDPDAYLRSGINIEALHSEIEEVLLDTLDKGNSFEKISAFRPYNELTYIFASVINEIQNGPISEPHTILATKLQWNDAVVTFNWDTLMDRALHQTGRWSVDQGYGFLPKSIYRKQWVAPAGDQPEAGPVLLKLHGSSNWLTSHPVSDQGKFVPMQAASPDTVWVYEHSKEPYDCYAGRYMPGYEPFSYGYYPPNILDDRGKPPPEGHVVIRMRPKVPWKPEGSAGSSGLVSAPLIIPPVRNKRYDAFGALFHDLWKKAQDAIQLAEHIVIVGYSFPRTDTKSRDMFVQAFMNRRTIPVVSIVDPFPDPVVSVLNLDFGIPRSHLRVYKSYFAPDHDIDGLFTL